MGTAVCAGLPHKQLPAPGRGRPSRPQRCVARVAASRHAGRPGGAREVDEDTQAVTNQRHHGRHGRACGRVASRSEVKRASERLWSSMGSPVSRRPWPGPREKRYIWESCCELLNGPAAGPYLIQPGAGWGPFESQERPLYGNGFSVICDGRIEPTDTSLVWGNLVIGVGQQQNPAAVSGLEYFASAKASSWTKRRVTDMYGNKTARKATETRRDTKSKASRTRAEHLELSRCDTPIRQSAVSPRKTGRLVSGTASLHSRPRHNRHSRAMRQPSRCRIP
ncbi:hypothetical protein LX36DRAFT_721082 [Colletotrichum falcatum]|nr:hypothetical protein LX36DRAFT_721082 [Colletotrichum falcatum]